MREIEYLVAWDDNTWTVITEEIPATADPEDYGFLLSGSTPYRKAVMIAVYNDNPNDEPEWSP